MTLHYIFIQDILWIEQVKQKRPRLPLNYTITLEKRTKAQSIILSETIYTNSLRWFIIEIVVEGERIEVSIDGKKMMEAKDSEFTKGQVALITEQRLPLTVIDDFVIRPLGKKGMFSKKENGRNAQSIVQNLNSSEQSYELKIHTSKLQDFEAGSSSISSPSCFSRYHLDDFVVRPIGKKVMFSNDIEVSSYKPKDQISKKQNDIDGSRPNGGNGHDLFQLIESLSFQSIDSDSEEIIPIGGIETLNSLNTLFCHSLINP